MNKIEMKDEIENRPKEVLRFSAIIGLLVLLMASMVATTFFTVTNTLEQEQMLTLKTVSDKITDGMSTYFDTLWSYVRAMAHTMQFEPHATQQDVLDMLGKVEQAHNLESHDDLLLLMDEKGYYYTVDAGRVALWQSFSSTIGAKQENEEVMLGDLAELQDHQERYICFVKKFEHPIVTSDGVTFTHIVMAMNESMFDIDMSLGEFGQVADAFVMANNGRRVSNQGGTLDISRSHNLLVALKDTDFLKGDSYNEIVENIQNDGNGVSLVGYKGKEYYIAYHSLGIKDWNTVFIVESSHMSDRVSPIVYTLLIVLIVGFTILTITLISLIVRRYNESKKNNELQLAAQIAEQSNKAKSDFMSRMSHDIRTPLSGIISWTDIARDGMEARDCEAVSECMDNIQEASNYLLDLVSEILDMSQLEHGNIQVKLAPLQLTSFLESSIRILQGRISRANLTLQVDFSGIQHPNVIADQRILNHILLNILTNAIKYNQPNGSIRFTVFDVPLDAKNCETHFIIADTGIGMKQEFVDHIFERFVQETSNDDANEARTKYSGVGLGMAITKELVDKLGGQITVTSEKNVGSTFEVILNFELCDELPSSIENAPVVLNRAYHVLLAEDVAMNRKAMKRLLERAGLVCDVVDDGLQAVETFDTSKLYEYDAILMDIMMPTMNGHQATRAIRASKREDAKTIPIFALSANALPADIQKSMEAGMNVHLSKPLVINDVIKALNMWCVKEK